MQGSPSSPAVRGGGRTVTLLLPRLRPGLPRLCPKSPPLWPAEPGLDGSPACEISRVARPLPEPVSPGKRAGSPPGCVWTYTPLRKVSKALFRASQSPAVPLGGHIPHGKFL